MNKTIALFFNAILFSYVDAAETFACAIVAEATSNVFVKEVVTAIVEAALPVMEAWWWERGHHYHNPTLGSTHYPRLRRWARIKERLKDRATGSRSPLTADQVCAINLFFFCLAFRNPTYVIT